MTKQHEKDDKSPTRIQKIIKMSGYQPVMKVWIGHFLASMETSKELANKNKSLLYDTQQLQKNILCATNDYKKKYTVIWINAQLFFIGLCYCIFRLLETPFNTIGILTPLHILTYLTITLFCGVVFSTMTHRLLILRQGRVIGYIHYIKSITRNYQLLYPLPWLPSLPREACKIYFYITQSLILLATFLLYGFLTFSISIKLLTSILICYGVLYLPLSHYLWIIRHKRNISLTQYVKVVLGKPKEILLLPTDQ